MRQVHLACIALLLSAGLSAPAVAQTVTGADITWYGVYQHEGARDVSDPSVLGGKRKVGAQIKPPSVNSDRVAIADNTAFGFGYQVKGEPAGAEVTLKVVQKIPAPGVFNKTTGKRTTSGEFESPAKIGVNRHTGFIIGKGAAIPAGPWTFEVWCQGRKLTGKTFTLYRP